MLPPRRAPGAANPSRDRTVVHLRLARGCWHGWASILLMVKANGAGSCPATYSDGCDLVHSGAALPRPTLGAPSAFKTRIDPGNGRRTSVQVGAAYRTDKS